ncbi:acyl carrier protein [bacterium]|nr:acyl carrier protein [bacterium]
MSPVSSNEIRQFIIDRYADTLRDGGYDPAHIDPDMDLMGEGIVDSFGVIELIGAIERRFGVELDLSGLNPEHLTVIAPFCEYIAKSIG